MRIVIIHDQVAPNAREDEQDVLVQAAFVRDCLERLGHEVSVMEFGLDLSSAVRDLGAIKPDLVFNLVESMMRSGRLIGVAPTLLEALGIPYTGCRSESVWLTSGKLMTKRWLRASGLPTADWFEASELRRLVADSGSPAAGRVEPGPWIVKSVWEHASVGLEQDSVIEVGAGSDTDRARALAVALARLTSRVGGEGFVERYIEGREFNIGLLAGANRETGGGGGTNASDIDTDPQVLPAAEIEFLDFPPERRRVVGFNAKWVEDSFEYQHTVRKYEFAAADAGLLAELRALSLRCWRVFKLRGYSRVDFRVDGAGRPWILEINANPCISPDAGFMAAAERAGMTGDEVVGRIAGDAGG